MKRSVGILAIVVCMSCQSYGQSIDSLLTDSVIMRYIDIYSKALNSGIYTEPRDTTWKKLQAYETGAYILRLPKNWINQGSFGSLVDVSFDGSGLFFPEKFNDRYVLTGVAIMTANPTIVEDGLEEFIRGYRKNTDRVFEKDYKEVVQKIKLVSGQDAYLVHTRFYRTTTQFNQSRYDLVVYCEKANKVYDVVLTIQYADPSYQFERDNKLNGLATHVYANFWLK